MMWKRGTAYAVISLLFMVILQACYSFTGVSTALELKTIAVPVFDDRSGAGIAQFRAELTRGIVDKIESQSILQLVPFTANADALLEGVITSFSDDPSQLSSKTERAITNRITLVVHVQMNDQKTKKTIFAQPFIGFADYPVGNYTARQEAIHFCLVQIIDRIFDCVVSGW
ncbi:MAG: LptE family protein [Chlorobiaceae bacterium]